MLHLVQNVERVTFLTVRKVTRCRDSSHQWGLCEGIVVLLVNLIAVPFHKLFILISLILVILCSL